MARDVVGMQLDEYMAEVRGIHLELAHLFEHYTRLAQDRGPQGADAERAASLLQRQKRLHVRLAQLDALVQHTD